MQQVMLNTENLSVEAHPVDDILLIEEPSLRVCGVILGNFYKRISTENIDSNLFYFSIENGQKILSKSVVITTGTFLRANINLGLETRPAGRLGDQPSIELGNSIEKIGFKMGRLKTGTPPRIDGRTIDYTKVEKKFPDYPPVPFSFMNDRVQVEPDQQLLSHMTHTNSEVAKIIKDTLHLNRHVKEETRGPRYFISLK